MIMHQLKILIVLIIAMCGNAFATGPDIVVTIPGGGQVGTPISPPPARDPIPVRPVGPDGTGMFDGSLYEYCGPAGYKCNLMRTDAVSKMLSESKKYSVKQLKSHKDSLDTEMAKIDKDLAESRAGLVGENSPAGQLLKGKLTTAANTKAQAASISDETLALQIRAAQEQSSTIDVSLGLAFKDQDKTEYREEARKIETVVANRFLEAKLTAEMKRADEIEAQINRGQFSNKEDRLEMVKGGRAAFEISAQSLAEGDLGKSDFARKVGTTMLDVAISVTPILGWGKDVYEAAFGRNLITGEELNGFERSMAVFGVLTAGIGSKLVIAGKAAVFMGVITKVKGVEKANEAINAVRKAEEIVESASKVKRFGPLESGPLHEIKTPTGTIADTFRSSSYSELTTKVDTKLYRVYSADDGRVLGPYWSRIKPSGPLQAQLDSALDPSWGNKANAWVEINVPAGNRFYEGSVSPVILQTTENKIPVGQLYGGGSQIYFDQFIPENWVTATGVF